MFLHDLLSRAKFTLLYYFNPPWDTGQSPPELLEFLESQPSGRALDLGCGTGTNALTLARHGWRVTAVDFASPAIRQARRKARRAGLKVDFRVADVTDLRELPDPFDLVLDIGCYHALTSQGRRDYRDNLKHLLAEDGSFLLYTFLGEGEGDRMSGISETEVSALTSWLVLERKEVGTERGRRPSAWFWFSRTKVND